MCQLLLLLQLDLARFYWCTMAERSLPHACVCMQWGREESFFGGRCERCIYSHDDDERLFICLHCFFFSRRVVSCSIFYILPTCLLAGPVSTKSSDEVDGLRTIREVGCIQVGKRREEIDSTPPNLRLLSGVQQWASTCH